MTKNLETRLAASVAALFIAACSKNQSPSDEAEPGAANVMPANLKPAGQVQCLGIHECKGKSACHVIGAHACAGQNECKGKGWVHVSRAECEAKGGKVLDS